MITHTVLNLEAIQNDVPNVGTAGPTEYLTNHANSERARRARGSSTTTPPASIANRPSTQDRTIRVQPRRAQTRFCAQFALHER